MQRSFNRKSDLEERAEFDQRRRSAARVFQTVQETRVQAKLQDSIVTPGYGI